MSNIHLHDKHRNEILKIEEAVGTNISPAFKFTSITNSCECEHCTEGFTLPFTYLNVTTIPQDDLRHIWNALIENNEEAIVYYSLMYGPTDAL